MKIGSINVIRDSLEIADYHSVPHVTITDVVQKKKRGLTEYRIEGVRVYNSWTYEAIIDTSWFIDTCKSFDSLRDASNYIKKYVN